MKQVILLELTKFFELEAQPSTDVTIFVVDTSGQQEDRVDHLHLHLHRERPTTPADLFGELNYVFTGYSIWTSKSFSKNRTSLLKHKQPLPS